MRRIDKMTEQDFEDLFMNNFDCYADDGKESGPPAMTKEMFLKIINEIIKEITNE